MQKPAYVVLISDWSSDVCSSDLFDKGLLASFRVIHGKRHFDEGAFNGGEGETRRLERLEPMLTDPHFQRHIPYVHRSECKSKHFVEACNALFYIVDEVGHAAHSGIVHDFFSR